MFPEKADLDLNIKEMWDEIINIKVKIRDIDYLKNENMKKDNKISDLSNEIKELKKEIKNLKNEGKKEIDILKNDKNELIKGIDILKNRNKEITKKYEEINKEIIETKVIANSDSSMVMDGYEEGIFIFNEIEKKINKRIKRIKYLYQATIDGGDTINFHNKCDNIPNTLVIILSEGHRRFGGFTPIPWKSYGGYKKDEEMKTFVFSLDNKKIYNLKNKETIAVYHHCQNGPCFGYGNDIGIVGNPIKENKLFTYQSSYDYGGGKQSLSEYKEPQKLKALEYEVFQIIFS